MLSTSKRNLLIIAVILLSSILSAETNKKNILKSLVVPGWGQLSSGSSTGYAFLASETMLWLSKYYYIHLSDLSSNKSLRMAVKNAGINSSNNSENYLNNVGNYISSGFESGGYNESVMKAAKANYSDPQEQQQYLASHIYNDDKQWAWNSKSNKRQFKLMRKDASYYLDYSKTIGGIIIVNHLISAIQTAIISRKSNFHAQLNLDRNNTPNLMCSYNF